MHQPPERAQRGPRPAAVRGSSRGMALAVEPMVVLGSQDNVLLDDEWTVATVDGSLAAHFEHTFTLTPAGSLGADGARRRSGAARGPRRPLRRR